MLLLPSFLLIFFILRLLLDLFCFFRLVLDIACYAFHSLVVSQLHAPPLPLSLFLLLSFYVLFWVFGTSFHRLPFFAFYFTSDAVSSYLSHISFRLLFVFFFSSNVSNVAISPSLSLPTVSSLPPSLPPSSSNET